MSPKSPYSLVYAAGFRDHLKLIERKYYGLISEKIVEQLLFEPDVPTRNRKPLEQPAVFSATWELRFGSDNQFRVFYDLDVTQRTVQILAIGIKVGNVLRIGDEEYGQ